MPSLKVVIRNDVKSDGTTNIKIALTHKRRTVYLKTPYYIYPNQIAPDGKIKKSHNNSAYLNFNLSVLILKYEKELLKIGSSIDGYSAMDLKQILIGEKKTDIDFYSFASKRIQELKDAGKNTYISYQDSVKRLQEFYQAPVLPFHEISKKFLEEFEHYCLTIGGKEGKGRAVNSVAVYMRSIRAIFYDALDELNREGVDPYIKNNPFFRKFKIRTEKTKKRNVDIDTIILIRDKVLQDPQQIFARDMFMLQFYLIGINVKDLFYYKLPVSDRIDYNRFKTGRAYSIKIEPEAREIIEKYKGETYILKFADYSGIKPDKKHTRYLFRYQDHRSFNKAINEGLKGIADITTYYARHSWATIARNVCGISKDDISLCLGHKDPSKNVTDIYLNEDLSIIDKSNRMVLDLLK